MAGYDPYGYEPQAYDPYNYDPYGYDFAPDTPPPDPDKNWVDPRKLNRGYLNRINKDYVANEFSGLKEHSLFLFEVLVEYLELKKDAGLRGEPVKTKDPDNKLKYKTEVKFFNLRFYDVSSKEPFERVNKKERTPSHTDLFQAVFAQVQRHITLVDNASKIVDDESKEVEDKNDEEPIEEKIENKDVKLEGEFTTIELMEGKAGLTSMKGLDMVQHLLVHPIVVRVSRGRQQAAAGGETEGEEKGEEEVTQDSRTVNDWELVGTARLRLPEVFARVVLDATHSDVPLPVVSSTVGRHMLLDTDGLEVGVVRATCTLTCVGQAVVNSVREKECGGFDYGCTKLLKHLRLDGKGRPQEEHTDQVTPEVLMAMDEAIFGSVVRTSEDALESCMRSNPSRGQYCGWMDMVRNALPWRSCELDEEDIEEVREEAALMEYAEIMRVQRQECREFLRDGMSIRPSAYWKCRLDQVVTDKDWEELHDRGADPTGSLRTPDTPSPTVSDFPRSPSPSRESRPKSILKT